ncbi:hypothetical protein LX32DRAFT_346406 [Colletotrichum zoysiae]|uniref:Uncharacterized protein n=1 Tax=Colletotrichum zoysiae TaxID=1216348 RepID=A0AAD9HL97_9PEZI|nr:hypothetical protein LX32DRAFT_346406 [Colletotrichum zoysiae]
MVFLMKMTTGRRQSCRTTRPAHESLKRLCVAATRDVYGQSEASTVICGRVYETSNAYPNRFLENIADFIAQWYSERAREVLRMRKWKRIGEPSGAGRERVRCMLSMRRGSWSSPPDVRSLPRITQPIIQRGKPPPSVVDDFFARQPFAPSLSAR